MLSRLPFSRTASRNPCWPVNPKPVPVPPSRMFRGWIDSIIQLSTQVPQTEAEYCGTTGRSMLSVVVWVLGP